VIRVVAVSPSILKEVEGVIQAFAETVVPRESIAVVTDLIVTGDSHLRILGGFRSITIVSPREFLDAKVWEAG